MSIYYCSNCKEWKPTENMRYVRMPFFYCVRVCKAHSIFHSHFVVMRDRLKRIYHNIKSNIRGIPF